MLTAPVETLSGKEFKILRSTIALEIVDGRRKLVTVPDGSIVKVVSGPTEMDPLVHVNWGTRQVEMFAVDVQNRGTEIKSRNADDVI